MSVYNIGVDLGGTKTEIILLDPDENIIHRERISTPKEAGYNAIVKTISELVQKTVPLVPESSKYTIGVGIPGSINKELQVVQNANTTCLNNMPLKKDLEKELGMIVEIENDANCFTLSETIKGSAKGFGLIFGIIIGTGCGGGISIDGKLRRGSHSISGEWGHFSVDPNGVECYCGNKGCVETKISGSGVESAFFSKYEKHLTMEEILSGYRKGNIQCTDIFNCFLDDFGRCLGGLISILDPDAVVLGGGLSNIDELYTIGVSHVQKYASHKKVGTPILKNSLGDSAGVFGAAWIGSEKYI